MIFSAQPGWFVVGHGVRFAEEGPPLHFFTWPVVAWRHDKGRLIPMTYEEGAGSQWAVAGPDGRVSTGGDIRLDREDYETRVIASDPRAKAEFERREAMKREAEADAKLAAMTQRRSA
jgi:hypothetical protein